MGALRRALDLLYLAGGVLGALALVAILLLILAGVAARQVGRVVPSADDLTAFAVAGSAILPLAYSFRHGAHIRVDLVIGRLAGRARTALEALVLAIAFAMVAFFAYSTFDQMTDSFEFGEVSQGMLGVPLWIPQMALPIGAGLFALALLDDLVVVLAGGTPSYRVGQAGGALDRAVEEI